MFGKRKQAKLDEYANRPLMSSNVTQFMEKLGLSDEEIAEMANPTGTVDPVQTKLDESDAALGVFVKQTNDVWSQRTGSTIELQPYNMIPTSCWDLLEQQDRELLIDVVGLMPSQPWNIVLLAMNDETAGITGAARYPAAPTEEAVTAASVAKLTITDELDMLRKQEADVTNFAEARDAANVRIIAMARVIGSASLGQHVIDQSRALFFGD